LPKPVTIGTISVEEALQKRTSVREYTDEPLTLNQVSQLLWATQGVNRPERDDRTTPSAGGTYPLEVYVVVSEDGVTGLAPGAYRYIPLRHSITPVSLGDHIPALSVAAFDQEWAAEAEINIVIAAVFNRTTRRYGERGTQYVYMEAGHAAQNIYLQAAALGLGTVMIGGFNDELVQRVIGLPEEQKPLYIAPVGYPRS
jgi:SagB-type dehydrogenase family enzyme